MASLKGNVKGFAGRFITPPFPVVKTDTEITDALEFDLDDQKRVDPPIRSQFTTEENGYTFRMPIKLKKADPVSGEYLELILPNEPFVSIYGAKDITKTTIQRGKKKGTVREERNLADYRIRIQGICINHENDQDIPEEQIRSIRNFFEQPGSLEIENVITSIWGITKLSLLGVRMNRNAKLPINTQPYNIEAESDEDFELEIK